jgi:hypothetical protein
MPLFPQHEIRPFIMDRPLRPVTPDESDTTRSHARSDESIQGLTTLGRSQSIPIGSRLTRTPSETKLQEEETIADYRDFAMFSRIVQGIHKTQQETKDCRWRYANDLTLQHIYKARNESDTATIATWGLVPEKLQRNVQATSLVELLMTPVEPEEEEESMFTFDM